MLTHWRHHRILPPKDSIVPHSVALQQLSSSERALRQSALLRIRGYLPIL
jgi:hypothetical protein